MIFSAATLREMLAHRPATAADFLDLNGVGNKKLTGYGTTFLEVIARHHDTADNTTLE
jgi:ATP-dependent DNA helicase RecQ